MMILQIGRKAISLNWLEASTMSPVDMYRIGIESRTLLLSRMWSQHLIRSVRGLLGMGVWVKGVGEGVADVGFEEGVFG